MLNDKKSILVVGDVMLDRYWFGEVERISPEAPVPVVRVSRSEDRAGGAANVARNVTALGGETVLFSVIGNDEAGDTLGNLMATSGVTTFFERDDQLNTTLKLRVLGRQQQMLRIDFETQPGHEVLARLGCAYRRTLAESAAVILSDYGKGGLTHIREMMDQAIALGCPIFIDPKGADYERYRGATVLTPNRSELRQVIGAWSDEADLAIKAQNLRDNLGLEVLLLTRSEDGMTLFSDEGVIHIPALAREVFDVSGAGDTVIAALAAMRVEGRSWLESTFMANAAASVVVSKLGTAMCSRAEMQKALFDCKPILEPIWYAEYGRFSFDSVFIEEAMA